jgi:hypothetical protein
MAVAWLRKLLLSFRLSLSTEEEVLPDFSLANDNNGCVLSQTYMAISFLWVNILSFFLSKRNKLEQ